MNETKTGAWGKASSGRCAGPLANFQGRDQIACAGNGASEYRGGGIGRTVLGVLLAAAIILGWLALLVGSVLHYSWSPHSVVTAPMLVLAMSWLYVGLFIVAHDCMHGSLIPRRPSWNRAVGRVCVLFYAGFNFDRLKRQHFLHHRFPGTSDDPDFDTRSPQHPVRWYVKFFSDYFAPWQLVWMTLMASMFVFAGDARIANLLAFWALPSLLSSVQLFYFGTYRPHRPTAKPFADHHRAHGCDYGWWASLLTCFHFGHHRVHHQYPYVPWWGLPGLAKAEKS